jgi:hypothetical protein
MWNLQFSWQREHGMVWDVTPCGSVRSRLWKAAGSQRHSVTSQYSEYFKDNLQLFNQINVLLFKGKISFMMVAQNLNFLNLEGWMDLKSHLSAFLHFCQSEWPKLKFWGFISQETWRCGAALSQKAFYLKVLCANALFLCIFYIIWIYKKKLSHKNYENFGERSFTNLSMSPLRHMKLAMQ